MKTPLCLPALFSTGGCRILKYGGSLPFLSGLERPVISTPGSAAVTVAKAARPGTAAPFTTTAAPWLKAWQMPPRPKLPEDELEEVYLKGSGPGGQKIVRLPLQLSTPPPPPPHFSNN